VFPLAVLSVRVLPEERTRMKPEPWLPSPLTLAVFPLKVLPSERLRWMPRKKPVTWQFMTVTFVLPLRKMPLPEPDPVTK